MKLVVETVEPAELVVELVEQLHPVTSCIQVYSIYFDIIYQYFWGTIPELHTSTRVQCFFDRNFTKTTSSFVVLRQRFHLLNVIVYSESARVFYWWHSARERAGLSAHD